MHWKKRFNDHTGQFAETAFLQHVSKTVGGTPITEQQFEAIVNSIAKTLILNSNKTLLDLCCGNGIVTKHLAPICNRIDAIDFSESLLEVAKKYNQFPNIRYQIGSILGIQQYYSDPLRTYHCISMYEALQCFTSADLITILSALQQFCLSETRILLGSVPDIDRIWNFYNTPERKDEYFRRSAEGTEAIGTWWSKAEIEESARQTGFSAQFLTQPALLHTSHYRFDVLLKPI